MKLYLMYNESRHFSREPDPDDAWDAGDTQVDWEPVEIRTKRPKNSRSSSEEFEMDDPPEEIHVVAVRYRTGGTFGHTDGEWKVEGYFKKMEDATKLQREIRKDNAKNTISGYVYWSGYFEHLEDVEIHTLITK